MCSLPKVLAHHRLLGYQLSGANLRIPRAAGLNHFTRPGVPRSPQHLGVDEGDEPGRVVLRRDGRYAVAVEGALEVVLGRLAGAVLGEDVDDAEDVLLVLRLVSVHVGLLQVVLSP